MKVGRSKTGLPTITENGGGMTNTGYATVIANRDGSKPTPIYIPRGYANDIHAIFVARPGMYIIHASRDRYSEYVGIHKIVRIGTNDDPDELVTELVAEYENGDGNIPEFLKDAAAAALDKAFCYHCREPHYAGKEKKRGI